MNQAGSTKTDTIVKLMLVFFISLLSFSMGTYVGKRFSDHQAQVAKFESGTASEASAPERSIASEGAMANDPHGSATPPGEASATPGESVPTDEEVRQLAKEFALDASTPPGASAPEASPSHNSEPSAAVKEVHSPASAPSKPQAAGKLPSTAQPEPKKLSAHEGEHSPSPASPEVAKPSPAAERVAQGKAPIATNPNEDTNTKPVATVPPSPAAKRATQVATELPRQLASSPVGKFTVQIASYPEEELAKQSAEDLRKKGYAAFYISTLVNQKTWHRVNVGLFSTKSEADRFLGDLRSKEGIATAIVQRVAEPRSPAGKSE